MAVIGKQYAVTASAVALTHADILGITNSQGSYAQALVIKNSAGAANAAYIGGSGVTNAPANAFGQLSAGGEYRLQASDGRPIRLDDLFLVGTANATNVLFISVIL